MGIGNSKLNTAEGEAAPAKIRCQIEEIKKRMNGETTLSKKKLLKDSDDDDDDDDDDNSRSSRETDTECNKVSSPHEIQIQPPKEETVARGIAAEKFSRVVPVPNSEGEIVEENHADKDNVVQVKRDMDQAQDKVNHVVEIAEAEVKTEEGKTAELVKEPKKEKEQELGAKGDDHDDTGNDHADEDESEELSRFLCPGSPSFRIYCIEAEKNNEEECNSPNIIVHQKSHSADSAEAAASRNSTEVLHDVDFESESTTKRKGHKKKFGAMKTLLKVKSCYHPMCTCTGDERTLVVAAKAAK